MTQNDDRSPPVPTGPGERTDVRSPPVPTPLRSRGGSGDRSVFGDSTTNPQDWEPVDLVPILEAAARPIYEFTEPPASRVPFNDPNFRYPSGKTRAQMEEFHRQWELDHAEAAVIPFRRPQLAAPLERVACPTCGEGMPAVALSVHVALRHLGGGAA